MDGGKRDGVDNSYELAFAYMLAKLLTCRRRLPPTLTYSVSHTHMRTHSYMQDEWECVLECRPRPPGERKKTPS